jgi:hypothetical protein
VGRGGHRASSRIFSTAATRMRMTVRMKEPKQSEPKFEVSDHWMR